MWGSWTTWAVCAVLAVAALGCEAGRSQRAYAWLQRQQGPFGILGNQEGDTLAAVRHDLFRDPNAAAPTGDLHYSAHPVMMPSISDPGFPMSTYNLNRLVRRSQVALVMDGVQDVQAQGGRAKATAFALDGMSLLFGQRYYNAGDADNDTPIHPGLNTDDNANAGNIRWRQHRAAAANVLFADGHARSVKPADVKKRNIRPDA